MYKFNGLETLFSRLGGAGNAAAGSVKQFASLLIILWLLNLIMNLKKLNENDYRQFIDKKCRERLSIYKEEIHDRMKYDDSQELKDDLAKVELLIRLEPESSDSEEEKKDQDEDQEL